MAPRNELTPCTDGHRRKSKSGRAQRTRLDHRSGHSIHHLKKEKVRMARKIIEDMFAPLASPMMPQALSAPSGEAAARFVRTALDHLPIEKLLKIP